MGRFEKFGDGDDGEIEMGGLLMKSSFGWVI